MPQTDHRHPRSRRLQTGRAIRFLAVHGVEREDPIAQAHGGDQRLRGGDLVRFLADHFMRENDLRPEGSGTDSAWSNGRRWRPAVNFYFRARDRRKQQGLEDDRADQRMDLPIRAGAAQHRDNRKQDDADLAVNLSFGAPPIRDGGKADTTWNELSEIHLVTGDMVYFTRAEALRSHPFPEVDFVVPEGAVWSASFLDAAPLLRGNSLENLPNSPVKMSRFDQAASAVMATINAAVSALEAARITKAIVSAA